MKTPISEAELVCGDKTGPGLRIITVYGQNGNHTYSIDEQLCLVESVVELLCASGILPGNPLWDVFLPDNAGAEAYKDIARRNIMRASENISTAKSLVSITLDNSLEAIPYPEEGKVTISRRYEPRARFEYFINGIQCRPKDILEIFDKAGVSQGIPVFNAILGGVDALSPLGLKAPAASDFINRMIFIQH